MIRHSSYVIRGLVSVLGLIACMAYAARAEASWGLRNSFGQSIYLVEPKVDTSTLTCNPCYDGNRRQPVDLEIMPFYNFGMVTLDLAFTFQMEQRRDLGFIIQFRPGVRIFPLLGLYIRASVPMTAANLGFHYAYFQYNLSVGPGYQLTLGNWGIFAEANLNPSLRMPFNMPVEFRVGILLQN